MNVADGTYNECNVSLHNSGSSSAPITFQSQNKWGAKIVTPVGCASTLTVTGSWIALKYLDISGGGTSGGGTSGGATGIFLSGGSNHTVFGNKIHNIGNIASDTTNGMVGIFVATHNDLLDSNFIFNIGRTGCVSGSCPTNSDHSFYIDGAAGAGSTTIQNNITYNNLSGYDVQLFPGSLSNILIINNTFDEGGIGPFGPQRNAGCIVQGTVLSNSRIANNICVNPAGGVMIQTGCCGDSASNVTIDHNITTVANMVNVNNTYTIDSTNVFNVNPNSLFTNLSGHDYHLVSGSPAIGIGTSNGAPPVDIFGNARGSSIDAGAYEFTH